MPAKPAITNKLITCCANPVHVDSNDTHKRCTQCGAEWTRGREAGDYTAWLPKPPTPPPAAAAAAA